MTGMILLILFVAFFTSNISACPSMCSCHSEDMEVHGDCDYLPDANIIGALSEINLAKCPIREFEYTDKIKV